MLYGIIFSIITILRYYSFKTRAWDLGIFTQSLWTTLYANKFLYHTCELFINPSGSFFGVHFSPILFLVLPLYRIVTTPETLLVLQSFILALAAIPIYKLARENAGGRVVGLVFSSAYLMYPATQYVNWYDFHAQSFLPLFFAFAIYYITKKNWPRYFLFMFLSLLCEEHAAWIAFFIGVYLAWKFRTQICSMIRKEKPLEKKLLAVPSVTMIVSAVWYWFTLWQRDTFFPTNPAALEEFLGAGNFAILGAKNPLEIPLLVITRPINTVQALSYDGQIKLLYIALLFAPLAFFSFKAPSVLIPTIPWFGFSLLSQTQAHHILGHQYEAYLVAFIFAAAIFGLGKNFIRKGTLSGISGSVKKIVVFILVFFVIASPLCPIVNVLFPDYTSFAVGEHERLLSEVISIVPSDASILTLDNIFAQVSHRVDAYVVPERFLNSDIRQLAVDFVNQTMDKVEYILVDYKIDLVATEFVLSLLKTKSRFYLMTSRDNWTILLYRRKP
jgi:uncharacterized membrane protein